MSITYTSANAILDKCFGATNFTAPATLYFGLSTTALAIDGTGATEPSGNNYSRVAFTNNKTNWGNASNGSLANLTAITFPESSGSWGTITHVFISDAASAGNVWFYDALTSSRVVQSSTTVQFAIGAVTVQMTNA